MEITIFKYKMIYNKVIFLKQKYHKIHLWDVVI